MQQWKLFQCACGTKHRDNSVCEEKSRDMDIFLLGIWTTGQHKEDITCAHHSASATTRDRTTLLYTMKGQKVCRSMFCAVCGAGCTPLN